MHTLKPDKFSIALLVLAMLLAATFTAPAFAQEVRVPAKGCPRVEIIPIQKLDEAYQNVLAGEVKFRYVIDMASLK